MTSQEPAPYRLILLGPWDLRGPEGEKVRSVLSQPKRLCLLAYMALSGAPVARSTLVALFWPESDEERARNALSQSLHYLRRSLGPGVVESVAGDRVRVDPEKVRFDARELLGAGTGPPRPTGPASTAVSPEALDAARRILDGRDFFQGYNAHDNRQLQEWLDQVRREVRARAQELSRAEQRVPHGKPPGTEESTRGEVGGDPASKAPRGGDGRQKPGGARAGQPRPRRTPWRTTRRWSLVGGGTLLAVVLSLLALRGVGNSTPASGVPAEAPEVAVLLPRVTILGEDPDYSAEMLAQAVHDELVARLGSVDGLRPVFISFESEVWQLVRSLEAQGTADVPDWVLSISIRSGAGKARVVALLLRGPDYTDAASSHAGDYVAFTRTEALMDLPRRIAEDVVEQISTRFPQDGGRVRPPTRPEPR